MKKFSKLIVSISVLVLAGLPASTTYSIDSEPHMKTKLCNPAETFCADVTPSNRVRVDATIKSGGLFSNLTVGTTAVEIKVGASKLANRRVVTIMPKDRNMWWGYANTVTTANGSIIFKNQLLVFNADDTASIWVITDQAAKNASISEAP